MDIFLGKFHVNKKLYRLYHTYTMFQLHLSFRKITWLTKNTVLPVRSLMTYFSDRAPSVEILEMCTPQKKGTRIVQPSPKEAKPQSHDWTRDLAPETNSKENRRGLNSKQIPGGVKARTHLSSSKEQEIIISIRPELLRQLKQEESEGSTSPQTSSSGSASTESVSQSSSRSATPHSMVGGPMKELGEERRRKIRNIVRSLEEDGHPNFSLLW